MRLMLSAAFAVLAGPALAAPQVVTDFAPVQSLVMQVMGDVGTPTMLLPVGGDPHDFQLRPSQAAALENADVVFWIGPELTPALDKAIGALGGKALSVPLLHKGGGHSRDFADGEGVDPHAWLDPTNAEVWLGTIAVVLGKVDPPNAAVYAANAVAAEAKLVALDKTLMAQLAPVRGKPLIEFHDAFGYFADHYGLNVAATIELGDATTPSALRLAQIRQTALESRAVCAFPEAGRDPAFLKVVAEGTDLKIGAPQDPEAALSTDAPTPGLYADLLTHLAQTVVDCAGN